MDGHRPAKRRKTYRHASAIPVHLLNRCRIDLEERLWSQAYSLLEVSLTSGTGTRAPAQIPPPTYLALSATLAVHPRLTSRTEDAEKHGAASLALRYLSLVNQLVGSEAARFGEAFCFGDENAASLSGRRARGARISLPPESARRDREDEHDAIRDSYAQADSIWENARDFWHVVGWAMNCSVVHPARWLYWKFWLDVMLAILEDDLESRIATGDKDADNHDERCKESIIAGYLRSVGGSRSNQRAVLRAIFAHGSSKSLSEFPEIWLSETTPPRKVKVDVHSSKRQKLDVHAGQFADYFDGDSEDESTLIQDDVVPTSSKRQSRRVSVKAETKQSDESDQSDSDEIRVGPRNIISESKTVNRQSRDEAHDQSQEDSFSSFSIKAFGGLDAIRLRQRLFALLVRLCTVSPRYFANLEEFFDLCVEFIRPLSLPVFQAFVCPLTPYLSTVDQSSLCQILLEAFVSRLAKTLHSPVPTQETLTRFLAPVTANSTSFIDNAKVSLLVESLVRLLWTSSTLQYDSNLVDAIETGIRERRDKASWDSRRAMNSQIREQEDGNRTLASSSARLRLYIDMIRADAKP